MIFPQTDEREREFHYYVLFIFNSVCRISNFWKDARKQEAKALKLFLKMGQFIANDTIFEITSEADGFKPFARSVTIIAAICAIIFSIIGVLGNVSLFIFIYNNCSRSTAVWINLNFSGNLVTVIALLKYTRLRRHATTAFVISLSISDLIFSAVNLPLTASRYLNEAWVLGETLCRIFPLFFYGNVAVSLLSMVAITINR